MPEIDAASNMSNNPTGAVVGKDLTNVSSPPLGAMRSNNTLLISAARPRQFYERAARELLASGEEEIKLSALGDAIILAVKLATILQEKQAAILLKIETHLPSSAPKMEGVQLRQRGNKSSPGILVTMKRHAEFRGSRITPGYVSFIRSSSSHPEDAPAPEGGAVATEESATEVMGSMTSFTSNPASTTCYVCGGTEDLSIEKNEDLVASLVSAGLEPSMFAKIHKDILTRMLEVSSGTAPPPTVESGTSSAPKGRLFELEKVTETYPDVKAAYGRLLTSGEDLQDANKSVVGSVFITVFGNEKHPRNNPFNYALVFVVYPRRTNYPSEETYETALSLTGRNLMSALCDFNGNAKRSRRTEMRRVATARISLPDDNTEGSAAALLGGLNHGYHYGPSPRLNFVDDSSCSFRKAWLALSGISESQLVLGDGIPRRNNNNLSNRSNPPPSNNTSNNNRQKKNPSSSRSNTKPSSQRRSSSSNTRTAASNNSTTTSATAQPTTTTQPTINQASTTQ